MEEPPRSRRAKYPGLWLLVVVFLVVLGELATWFFRRDGSRETECGGFDCVTNSTAPVPTSAFVIGGAILVLLLVAMVVIVRAGGRRAP